MLLFYWCCILLFMGYVMLIDISKIYPNGVERSGLRDINRGNYTNRHKNNVIKYALAHTLDLASKKYKVNRNTIAFWVSEYNKAVAY